MVTYRVMLRGEHPFSNDVKTTDSIVKARKIAIKKLIDKNESTAWIMEGNTYVPTYLLTTVGGRSAKDLMEYDPPAPFRFYRAHYGGHEDAKLVRMDGTLVRRS